MDSKNVQNSAKNAVINLSITDLVRLNLNGVLAHYQGELEVTNAFSDAYQEYEKTGKNVSIIWKFTHRIFDFKPRKRKLDELSLAKIAKDLNVDVSVLRSIFERSRSKGSPEISVDEVVWMAKFFGVSPGYLLQPLREHLENDATLHFKSYKKFNFQVKAREWLLWVHGFRPLSGLSGKEFEGNLMALTPELGARVSTKRDIWPSDEMNRIGNALYGSPVSAMIQAQSEPVPGHKMSDANPPSPHPLDEIKAGLSESERLHRRTKAALAYMQHARQAIRFIEESSINSDARKDIDWCLNRMREDLSLLYVNLESQSGGSN